ncbi:4-alpha-glucanotransferase [Pontibacter ramchanderi]|uniref:4-alpha-glucanotransferase n=1 Tax=Pontibacter ramchanderi TaxID=1179743 RepID=A0A2N3U7Y6_9BACT|nr:4-alpha-glucanotransferase [Pontibacter ramchanderi]PKV62869.1 4-alpha-glucanotransferase [Pontibacter ramchanderi]
MIIPKRSSGILLHITSLPSAYGIGDLGPEAYKFADLLAEAGQRYWQILPLNPTEIGSGNSPYSSHSAFAGNPLLISPERLVDDGLLDRKDLRAGGGFNKTKVDFPKVAAYKVKLLHQAYDNFKDGQAGKLKGEFIRFQEAHKAWLPDFTWFVAFKHYYDRKPWTEWPEKLKNRQGHAMEALTAELAGEIEREAFFQFLFYRQWEALKAYCTSREITFIGDMPFYVSHDSADVWAHPHIFKLDRAGMPTAVSGVPPDYFSESGQLWGTPVFDWKALQEQGFDWWLQRIAHNLELFGLLRLDHFRAFSAYWEVPADEKTAINGKWVKTPGAPLLDLVRKRFPAMPIIAEDLGEIDQPVRDLMAAFDLPGMRVLLFAFGEDLPQSLYAPHHHVLNSIVYTGTHDNSTVRAWYEHDASRDDKKRLSDYSGQQLSKENAHQVMGRLAYMSVAQLVVLPLQDVLGLGKEAIMNKPSTANGNWLWRLQPGLFTKVIAKKLRQQVELYGR